MTDDMDDILDEMYALIEKSMDLFSPSDPARPSRDKIREDMNKYVHKYMVPIKEARRSVLRNYGVSPPTTAAFSGSRIPNFEVDRLYRVFEQRTHDLALAPSWGEVKEKMEKCARESTTTIRGLQRIILADHNIDPKWLDEFQDHGVTPAIYIYKEAWDELKRLVDKNWGTEDDFFLPIKNIIKEIERGYDI